MLNYVLMLIKLRIEILSENIGMSIYYALIFYYILKRNLSLIVRQIVDTRLPGKPGVEFKRWKPKTPSEKTYFIIFL